MPGMDMVVGFSPQFSFTGKACLHGVTFQGSNYTSRSGGDNACVDPVVELFGLDPLAASHYRFRHVVSPTTFTVPARTGGPMGVYSFGFDSNLFTKLSVHQIVVAWLV